MAQNDLGIEFGGTWDQTKSAVKLALKHRQAIKDGDLSVFIPALAFAIIKDGIFDEISTIPILGVIGTAFGAFIAVYLFIFLWGKGKWKVRLVVSFFSFLDIIPGIDLIPLTTLAVVYAFSEAKKNAKKAKKQLNSPAQKMSGDDSQARWLAIREAERAMLAATGQEQSEALASGRNQQKQYQEPSRLSQAADWAPVIGSMKMMGESLRGKEYGGKKLDASERVKRGAEGTAFLAADLTGVGEAARLGKAGMVAARMGERAMAERAIRGTLQEGYTLHERGKERVARHNNQQLVPQGG